MKDKFLKFWQDPVWSKVIATGILAGLGLLLVKISDSPASTRPLIKVLIGSLLIAGLCTVLYRAIKKSKVHQTKTLVYVSSGGTCRDPMAKAITTKLLEKRELKHPVQIKAMALGPPSEPEASFAARYVIKEMYGEDLLAQHKPELLTSEAVQQADLILVMDKHLLLTPGKTFPREKTFLLKEFFGLKGDLVDPWPDGRDQATFSRYKKCAEEIKDVVENNIERLVKILDL